MNEDLPVINESDFNSQFGGGNIPTINESDFNKISAAPETSGVDTAVGALKGIAQAGTDVLTAPADLLTHLGNSALNYITGTNVDPTGHYPSDYVSKFLDSIDSAPSGAQGDPTAQSIAHVTGDLGLAVAAPSQAATIADNIPFISKAFPTLAKVLGYSAEGAGFNELGNPQGDLTQNAEVGAGIGAATVPVSALLGKVLGVLPGSAARSATATAQDVAEQIRSIVPDALTAKITPAERAVAGSTALEKTGAQARTDAGALFNNLPPGQVSLDQATQSIKDYAEQLSGPAVPGSRTAQLVGYLDRLKAPEVAAPVADNASPLLQTMRSIFHGPAPDAAQSVAGKAVVDINQFQNILRDVGKFGEGAIGPERAIIAHAKEQLLNAGATHLAPEAQAALTEARNGWRDMAQTFEDGGVAKARAAVTDPNKGTLALKNVLLGDPKGAQQVAAVMAPHELANAQNLMLSDLLKMQPVSWARRITTKMDNYNAVFGEEGTQRLVNMMSRDGTIGKKLLTDNVGLKAVVAKLALKTAIGGTVGEEIGGHKGGAAGVLLALGNAAGGNGVTRVQQLLMRAAAGEPGALAILNKPASQFAAQSGKVVELLTATAQRESAQQQQAQSDQKTKSAVDQIRADPYLHAAALTESNFNSKARNPNSSAKGVFQFIDPTAKALNLSDPFSIDQSLTAMKKLTAQNSAALGTTDPATLYAAHVLGAPLAKKWLLGKPLSDNEDQLVHYFLANLPRFQRNLKAATGTA